MRLPLYVLAVSGGALVQCTVVPAVGVGGIVPDIPVVLTVLLALRYGAEAGCLTGFALGFALRDIISSVLAGILIMLNRPFVAGDYIRLPTVAGIEGTVTAIELRYTAVSDATGQRHLVPNAKVLSEVVSLPPAPPAA